MTTIESITGALFRAHSNAAIKNESNLSNQAVALAAQGSQSFCQSVIAGLATLGKSHAPVTEARRLLYQTTIPDIDKMIASGKRIPGWGNSFYKESLDESWVEFDALLKAEHPAHHHTLETITALLASHGKKLWPNAAAYTAVTAQIIELPWGTELQLVIVPRVYVWAEIYAKAMKGTKIWE